MGEINFLLNNKNGANQDRSERKKGDEAIEWSKPAAASQKEDKKDFVWLDAFAKIKNLRPSGHKPDARLKIKRSRREVLELIKRQQKQAKAKAPVETHPVRNKTSNGAKRPSGSWLDWFKSIFKKKSHKDVLIDLEQIFSQEKEKRGTISKLFSQVEAKDKAVREEPAATKFIPQEKNEFARPLGFKPVAAQVEIEPKSVQPAVIKSAEAKLEPKVGKIKEAKVWQNPNIIETNLIKSEIVTYFDWRSKIIILINAIVLSCLAIGLVYGGLLFSQKQNAAENELLERKFAALESQVKQAEKNSNEILAWQKKLKIANALLARHIYWTNFFKFLEENTMSDVYFVNFSGTTAGSYTLNAMARNYNAISQQVNTLRANNKVTRVESSGGKMLGQSGMAGVNFILNIEVRPNIFTE